MAAQPPKGSYLRGMTGLTEHTLRALARALALTAVAFGVGQQVMRTAPEAVILHTETTASIGVTNPLVLLLIASSISLLGLWVGYTREVPFWGLGATFLLAGGAANMGSLHYYGGVPDFLPLGRLLLSVGDVYIALGWVCLLGGGLIAACRDRRAQRVQSVLLSAPSRRY